MFIYEHCLPEQVYQPKLFVSDDKSSASSILGKWTLEQENLSKCCCLPYPFAPFIPVCFIEKSKLLSSEETEGKSFMNTHSTFKTSKSSVLHVHLNATRDLLMYLVIFKPFCKIWDICCSNSCFSTQDITGFLK